MALKFTVSKDLLQKCVDWTAKPKPIFIAKRELNKYQGKEAFSDIFRAVIQEKFDCTLFVGNGKRIGVFDVTIYLHCNHNVNFLAKTSRRSFKEGNDIEFEIFRAKNQSDCICGKFLLIFKKNSIMSMK